MHRQGEMQRGPCKRPRVMAKGIRPPYFPQFDPRVSPEAKARRDLGQRLAMPKIDLTPPPSKRLREQPAQRKRRKGGGRRPALSTDTVTRLRTAYRNALRSKPKLAGSSLAYKFLHGRLPEAERNVSDRTLMRWIISVIRTK